MNTNVEFADKVVMTFLSISMIRGGFQSFNFDLSLVMIFGLAAHVILTQKIQIAYRQISLMTFAIVLLMEFPLQYISSNGYYGPRSSLNGIIVFLVMYMIVVTLCTHKGYKVIWNVINVLSIVASLLIVMQAICYYLIGINIDAIPVLSDFLFNSWSFRFYRPCGMFSEPSLYAEMVLFSLYYYSFININKKMACLHTVALILSTSSLGIIGVLFLYIMLFFNLNKIRGLSKQKKMLIIILVCLFVVALLIWISNTTNPVVTRIMNGGTSGVRILRSYELFDLLPLDNKVWGIGIQNQEIYLNYNNILLNSDTEETSINNREFAATIGYILCTTGMMGLVTFIMPFVKMMRKNDYRMKVLILLFLGICFSCCVFSRAAFCVFLILIFSTKELIDNEK